MLNHKEAGVISGNKHLYIAPCCRKLTMVPSHILAVSNGYDDGNWNIGVGGNEADGPDADVKNGAIVDWDIES